MSNFLQCYCQLEAFPRHFEISVPSVNDHPNIVDIFRKLHENGPCIQTISFRVTMTTVRYYFRNKHLLPWSLLPFLQELAYYLNKMVAQG